MISIIKSALKQIFLSVSPSQSQLQAMIKIDFKIADSRTNWIQLCFSALASWSLFAVLMVLYLVPGASFVSLQSVFQNYPNFTFWLLDGRALNMLLFFAGFFLTLWIVRFPLLMIVIIFNFLMRSEIHFHLALAALVGVFAGHGSWMWWLHKKAESDARKIWKTAMTLQMFAVFVSVIIISFALQAMHLNGFFAASATANRPEFFLSSLILIYFLQFVFLSVWGHFLFQQKREPADFPVCYSTAAWLKKIRLQSKFKKVLSQHVNSRIQIHEKNLTELIEIKDLSPVSIPAMINKILQAELKHLKVAASLLL